MSRYKVVRSRNSSQIKGGKLLMDNGGGGGTPGADGITPHIGENGNWFIGNTDTGVKATGPKGDPGKDSIKAGPKGADAPTPRIGRNNNWFIGNIDTGVKATGPQGDPGKDSTKPGPPGADGITPHIGENGNWFIGNIDTGVKATGPQGPSGEGSADVVLKSENISQYMAHSRLIRKADNHVIAHVIGPQYGGGGKLELWSSGKITLSFPYKLQPHPEAIPWTLGDIDVENISKFLVSEYTLLSRYAIPMMDKIAISKAKLQMLPTKYVSDTLLMTANLNRPSSDFIPPGLEDTELGNEYDIIMITYFGYVDISLFAEFLLDNVA